MKNAIAVWASRYGNDGLKMTANQSAGKKRPSITLNPAGVCIQLLAARIQKVENSVPTVTMIAAKK